MKLLVLIFSLLVCFNLVLSQPIQGNGKGSASVALTLRSCINLALENNLDIATARTEKGIASIYHNQAKASRLPEVNGYIDHGLNTGRSINPSDNSYLSKNFSSATYSLNASLSLWNGFKIRDYIRKNKEDLEAGRWNLEQQKDRVILEVIGAYLEVLNQQELLNNYYRQLLATQVTYNRIDTLNQSGAASPADLYDLKGQLTQNKRIIIEQKNQIKIAKINLFQLMNQPLDENVQFEEPALLTEKISMGSLEAIYQKAASILPMVKASKMLYKSAESNVAVEKADYYPSLSLNAGIGTAFSSAASRTIYGDTREVLTTDYVLNGSDKLPVYTSSNSIRYGHIAYFDQLKNNYGTSINLTLSIPLFNKLEAKSDVKVAKLRADLAKKSLTTTKRQLKNAVSKAYYDQKAALESWQQSELQVAAYKEYFRISEVKFKLGAINSAEYLIAKNKLEQAENNLVAAKYNFIFKSKILSYYRGSLSY